MASRVVTVLSNESGDLFPANTPSRFRNQLQLDLEPGVEYEVALISVSYVKSTFNFPDPPAETSAADPRLVKTLPEPRQARGVNSLLDEDEEMENSMEMPPPPYAQPSAQNAHALPGGRPSPYWIEYRPSDPRPGSPIPKKGLRDVNRVYLQPGYYPKEGFAAQVEDKRYANPNGLGEPTVWNTVTLSWVPSAHKFRLLFQSKASDEDAARQVADTVHSRVWISAPLAYRLGFSADGAHQEIFLWINYPSPCEYMSDVVQNFDVADHFFLQSSLVKPHHQMGNGRYPVLGIVPVARDVGFGERATYTVEKKIWLPLEPQAQDSAEFLFNTQRAGIMSFAFGVSWITLEIRPRRTAAATDQSL